MNNKLKILEDILYSHETRFDEDVIKYLLDIIPNEELLATHQVERKLGTTHNFEYETNFFGKALLFHTRIGGTNDIATKWQKIFNTVNPKYSETKFKVKCIGLPKNKNSETICNLDTVSALCRLSDYFENPTKYKNANRTILMQELLCDKTESFFTIHEPSENQKENIINLINEQREEVTELSLTKSSNFVARTIESDALRKTIYTHSSNIFTRVIKENDLGLVLDFCMNDKAENSIYVLSSVIDKYPAKEWMDSYCEDKSNNLTLLKLLKKQFFKTYGRNITEDFNTEIGKRSPEGGHVFSEGRWFKFKKVFESIISGIDKENTTNYEIAELYNSLMRTNDFETVDILNRCFPFDDVYSNIDSESKLKTQINNKLEQDQLLKVIKYRSDKVVPKNWGEWLLGKRKEKLESELSTNSNNNSSKKFKV